MSLETICHELETDLCRARLRHMAARRRLRVAETPQSRAAEAELRAQLDVVLDLLIELRGDRAARRRPRSGALVPFPRPGPAPSGRR